MQDKFNIDTPLSDIIGEIDTPLLDIIGENNYIDIKNLQRKIETLGTNDTNSVQPFGDWIKKAINERTIFRMWKYKRMFTPYEQQKAFSDETEHVNSIAIHIRIIEAVMLPDDDILLGYELADCEDGGHLMYIEYVKLSEIELAYSDTDQEVDDNDLY